MQSHWLFSLLSPFWEDPKTACRHTLPPDTRNRYAWPQRVHAKWREGMQEAYEKTKNSARKSAERGKRNHDRKVRSSELEPGDRVLVRNLTPRGGTGKLRSHWEETIHKVVRRVNKDAPFYKVVPEQGKGRDSRILHRNLLLPCDHPPLEVPLQVARSQRKNLK